MKTSILVWIPNRSLSLFKTVMQMLTKPMGCTMYQTVFFVKWLHKKGIQLTIKKLYTGETKWNVKTVHATSLSLTLSNDLKIKQKNIIVSSFHHQPQNAFIIGFFLLFALCIIPSAHYDITSLTLNSFYSHVKIKIM